MTGISHFGEMAGLRSEFMELRVVDGVREPAVVAALKKIATDAGSVMELSSPLVRSLITVAAR